MYVSEQEGRTIRWMVRTVPKRSGVHMSDLLDDKMGPLEGLNRLLGGNREFSEYFKKIEHLRISRDFHIPYGAGISNDGAKVYISSDIKTIVQGVDCGICLVYHEATEWGLREFCKIGLDYNKDPRGHEFANRVEARKASELLGLPLEEAWKIYGRIIDPQVMHDEDGVVADVPGDLALYPYTKKLQEKIKRSWNLEKPKTR